MTYELSALYEPLLMTLMTVDEELRCVVLWWMIFVDNVDDGCGWMGGCKWKEESGNK